MQGELNRRTREYYDSLIAGVGAEYLELRWGKHPLQRSHFRQTRRSVHRFFREVAGDGGNLLEVGCGPGTWTGICLQHADEVTVLDISAEMLRVTRERFRDDPRLRYVCADLEQVSVVENAPFDVIFSARALEYMQDKRTAVAKLRAALRPGGVVGIITKNPAWRDKVRARKAGEVDDAAIQVDWIHWRGLSSLLEGNGFADVRVRPVALGSYERPLNNRVGYAVAEALQWLTDGWRMRPLLDPLTESYLVTARAA